jgi:outer membrane protein
MKRFLLPLLLALATPALAQQKIGYVDSEAVLSALPEYAGVQQQLERLQQDWQAEITRRRGELDRMFRDYQARELLYTSEERQRRRDEIAREEGEVEGLRSRYFGPEGELFTQQQALMRPLQERILAAIEAVANADTYDYVFDRSGDFLFLFARPQHALGEVVLRELGVTTTRPGARPGQPATGNDRDN